MSVSSSTSAKRKAPASSTPGKVASKGGYESPWIERYRPQTLDEVVGNEETLVRLRAIGQDGNMPNLILSGMYFCLCMRIFIIFSQRVHTATR